MSLIWNRTNTYFKWYYLFLYTIHWWKLFLKTITFSNTGWKLSIRIIFHLVFLYFFNEKLPQMYIRKKKIYLGYFSVFFRNVLKFVFNTNHKHKHILSLNIKPQNLWIIQRSVCVKHVLLCNIFTNLNTNFLIFYLKRKKSRKKFKRKIHFHV